LANCEQKRARSTFDYKREGKKRGTGWMGSISAKGGGRKDEAQKRGRKE